TQSLPYPDQDVFTYEQLYLNIQLSFKQEFEWIEEVVSLSCLVGFRLLVELVEILPGKPDSPVSPFLSLVLNANVSTLAHLDGKDFVLCLVLAIGKFLGGRLVLGKQGPVVEARNGDFLAFCSESTTHFNLKY
ncbi:hypothetical protein M405DRAFT_716847, partial [Rhizopogon salebrosus TDB-379]